MKNDPLRRGLAWALAATLLLPMVLVVTLGTGGLLAAVGDDAAAVCRWVAVPLGILWVVAVAATASLAALLLLAGPRSGRPPRRRRRRAGDRA